MAVMTAVGLPDDKVEFFLTVPEKDRKDWPTLKKIFLAEYKTDQASSEQAFLSRMRQPGESFLVYITVAIISRRVRYRGRYIAQRAVTEGGYLSVSSWDFSTHFLQIATGLSKRIILKPRQIEEVLARTQSSVELAATVESTENVNKLDTLCNELSELRHLLREQDNPESALDNVKAVFSKQSAPKLTNSPVFFLWIYHAFAKAM